MRKTLGLLIILLTTSSLFGAESNDQSNGNTTPRAVISYGYGRFVDFEDIAYFRIFGNNRKLGFTYPHRFRDRISVELLLNRISMGYELHYNTYYRDEQTNIRAVIDFGFGAINKTSETDYESYRFGFVSDGIDSDS